MSEEKKLVEELRDLDWMVLDGEMAQAEFKLMSPSTNPEARINFLLGTNSRISTLDAERGLFEIAFFAGDMEHLRANHNLDLAWAKRPGFYPDTPPRKLLF